MKDYRSALDKDEDFSRAKEGIQKAQKLEKQAKKRDYYKILGVKRTASKKEINKASSFYYFISALRIRDPVPFWPLDPGGSTSRIIFPRARKQFLAGLKYLDSDPGIFLILYPGSGMEKNSDPG